MVRSIQPGNTLDLSEASFGQDTLSVDVGDFLDHTTLSRSTMFSSDDVSVGTLAELFDELLLSINGERRVEGGECVFALGREKE